MSNTDPILLFCAFRYALGRRTYVVNTVCQHIHRSWETLSVGDRKQFVEEILEHRDRFKSLGDVCDERDWLSIVDRYNSEL